MSATITGQVGSRGTIVLAAESRRRYGLEDGSLFILEERAEGLLIRPAKAIATDLTELRAKIQAGLDDIDHGRVFTKAEALKHLEKTKAEFRQRKAK